MKKNISMNHQMGLKHTLAISNLKAEIFQCQFDSSMPTFRWK